MYKLNDTFDVDASTVGNVTRFINHAPSKRANCITKSKATLLEACATADMVPKVMNVSGDHRIGIYAGEYPLTAFAQHRN